MIFFQFSFLNHSNIFQDQKCNFRKRSPLIRENIFMSYFKMCSVCLVNILYVPFVIAALLPLLNRNLQLCSFVYICSFS